MQAVKENIVILGMGVSGLSAARYFFARSKHVTVVDSRIQPPLLETFKKELPEVEYHLGGFDQRIINAASEIILSPGLAKTEPAVQQAMQQGIPVVGDVEVFARQVRKPIIAITGSNGKSTVTSLVTRMANTAKINAVEGGNIGVAVLDLIADGEKDDTRFYVLELSSFQLETTHSLKAHAAVVLNLSPDHMDRYDDFTAYCQAKKNIYQAARYTIVNLDDPLVQSLAQGGSGQVITFSLDDPSADFYLHEEGDLMHGEEKIINQKEIKLQGLHNYSNALAACALAHTMGVSTSAMAEVLATYAGLAHRSQLVRYHRQVQWINDSKGTNVGASQAAIKSIAAMPGINKIVLIAGGVGKGADYRPLQEVCAKNCRAVVLMGEDAEKIQLVLEKENIDILRATDMRHAVDLANTNAQPGDAVLLSPAGASFDFYKNYMERGEHFEKLVKELV